MTSTDLSATPAQPQPYYQDESVTLYHGDCRKVTDWIDADVLVTDPPYGIAWKRGKWANAHNPAANAGIQNDQDTTTRDAALKLWGDKPGLVFGAVKGEPPAGWRWSLPFIKPPHAGLVGSRMPWFRNWELVYVIGAWPDQTPTRSSAIATRALAASGYSGYATKAGHPHAKPLDVMEELVDACPPGVIADPFAGSGSTLVAAKALGRRAIGVELDESYCEVAARRLSQGVLDLGGIA